MDEGLCFRIETFKVSGKFDSLSFCQMRTNSPPRAAGGQGTGVFSVSSEGALCSEIQRVGECIGRCN